jgi:hypothetical protein
MKTPTSVQSLIGRPGPSEAKSAAAMMMMMMMLMMMI